MATKKELLAEAAKLGISDVNSKTKNAELEKRIVAARSDTVRYGGRDIPRCAQCGRPNTHVHAS